ncbi:hypothetical protein F0562_002847 [Nyssa sinensis]|uniref:Uncharacterized protein n=1 Tax=Nyssa sinensis TaxID=561372 RepID=A0A5J5BUW0_9ASTE|nr:hypothetical protein F0562_002847 [Nyssa sinensis]
MLALGLMHSNQSCLWPPKSPPSSLPLFFGDLPFPASVPLSMLPVSSPQPVLPEYVHAIAASSSGNPENSTSSPVVAVLDSLGRTTPNLNPLSIASECLNASHSVLPSISHDHSDTPTLA